MIEYKEVVNLKAEDLDSNADFTISNVTLRFNLLNFFESHLQICVEGVIMSSLLDLLM